jgi:HEXXH motif-containing protein
VADVETPFWDPSIGSVRRSLGEARGALVDAVVEFLVQLHLSGMSGSWQVALGGGPLRVGSCLLSEVSALRVVADMRGTELECDTPHGVRRAFIPRNSKDREWCFGTALPTAGPFAVASTSLTSSVALGWGTSPAAQPATDTAAVCRTALHILATHVPDYGRWVEELVRQVIAVPAAAHQLISNSDASRPGEIHITAGRTVAETLEMLVHEASHQHLFVAQLFGSLDDGTDARLYYSPVRGTKRPIGAILVAYHAVANISLAMRAVRSGGFDPDGYFERNENEYLAQVPVFEDALSTSNALTEAGVALWKPLHERLQSELD